MKNKIVLGTFACILMGAFALGAAGIVNPLIAEKEHIGPETSDRPIGFLIIRADAPSFRKAPDGKVPARCVEVPAEGDLPAYMDYVFDIERAYGIYEYKYGDTNFLHCDPELSNTKSSINYDLKENSKSEQLGFSVDLFVDPDPNMKYFVKTVYQEEDGDVYADVYEGDGISDYVSFEQIYPLQDSVEYSTTFDRKISEEKDGFVNEHTAQIKISLKEGALPDSIVVYEYDDAGTQLGVKSFTSETFWDDTYITYKKCAYFIVKTNTAGKVKRELVEEGAAYFHVVSQKVDGIYSEKSPAITWDK